MNEKQIKHLKDLCYKEGCTDSDIVEWCEENDVSKKEAFHQVAIWFVPEHCKKCKYVDFYSNLYPCNDCCMNK